MAPKRKASAKKRQREEAPKDPPPVESKAEEYDLWGEDVETPARPNCLTFKGKKKEAVERTDTRMRKQRKLLPHPAQSYNPDRKLHKEAADQAAKQLTEKEERIKKLALSLRPDPKLKKEVVGDDFTGTAWEETLNVEPLENAKKPKLKTRTQRNKIRRLKLEHRAKLLRDQQKALSRDAENVDGIKKDLESEKAEKRAKQQKKKAVVKNKLYMRLGRQRFKPTALDIPPEEELKSSVREQGVETAGVRDPIKLQFESFQAKNLIPATAPKPRRPNRYPTKYFLVTKGF